MPVMGYATEITILFTDDDQPPMERTIHLKSLNLQAIKESAAEEVGAIIKDALAEEYPTIFRASVEVKIFAEIMSELP